MAGYVTMIFNLAQGILVNLFLLLGFAALCSLLGVHALRKHFTIPAWADGLLFGFAAVVTMFMPVETAPGVMFDCRAAVIGAAALLGGPVTALASLPLPVGYRMLLGGEGTLPGLLELLLPAVIGSLCHLFVRRRPAAFDLRRIALASALVAFGTDALVYAVIRLYMRGTGVEVSAPAAVLIMLSTSVSMAVFSLLIQLERSHHLAVQAAAENERRMLHSQKMAALGQLAGKVSHDFTNALTVILGNAEEAKGLTTDAPPVTDLLDGIINTATRISGLSGELLTFAIPRPLRTQRLDLGTCLVGIEGILTQTLGREIEVVIRRHPVAGLVDMDPELIQQAILHMAVNAKDAISGRGRLIVSVAPAGLSAEQSARIQAGVTESNRHDGPFALLSVQDTGCGMTAETVSRIFEPFFSTKPKAKNAGLGLSTVYNIVQRHAGFIDVQSAPGQGATFMIYLPVVA